MDNKTQLQRIVAQAQYQLAEEAEGYDTAPFNLKLFKQLQATATNPRLFASDFDEASIWWLSGYHLPVSVSDQQCLWEGYPARVRRDSVGMWLAQGALLAVLGDDRLWVEIKRLTQKRERFYVLTERWLHTKRYMRLHPRDRERLIEHTRLKAEDRADWAFSRFLKVARPILLEWPVTKVNNAMMEKVNGLGI